MKTIHTKKCLGAEQACYHQSLDSAEAPRPVRLQIHSHSYFYFSVLLWRGFSFLPSEIPNKGLNPGWKGEGGRRRAEKYPEILYETVWCLCYAKFASRGSVGSVLVVLCVRSSVAVEEVTEISPDLHVIVPDFSYSDQWYWVLQQSSNTMKI